MKKTRLLILIPAIIIVAGGGFFGYRLIEQRQQEKVEEQKSRLPVLRIEEKTYSLSDFENYVRLIIPQGQEIDNETLSQLFDQFVEDRLILYSAK